VEGWVTEFTGIRTAGMFDDGLIANIDRPGANNLLKTEGDPGY
jgi:hypothetical protein